MPETKVQLDSLNSGQLSQLVASMEQTIAALQAQYEALSSGQKRFENSEKAMDATYNASTEEVLIPMTPSVYQAGELVNRTRFTVELGAGYYVDRSYEANKVYFKKRIGQIADSIKTLTEVMDSRKLMLEQTRGELRKKMMQQQGVQPMPSVKT